MTRLHTYWLRGLLITVIVIGVALRFTHLDGKIYWHDEAYTSLRAAGYTRHEIDAAILQNRFLSASALQQFQQIKPGSSPIDTINSLRLEDPQHPPLYFLMARGWLRAFGSSMTASRLLPAWVSLLSLPLMYGLAWELFRSPMAAWLATALLAISPFDILFAQTARQYSLLTVSVIAASWALVRAMSQPSLMRWGAYSLAATLGLYTHPFFGLSMIGFCCYEGLLGSLTLWQQRSRFPMASTSNPPSPWPQVIQQWLGFALANLVALLLYSPWLWVMISNRQQVLGTTDWTRADVPFIYLVKLWVLSFTSLFIDLDFGFDNLLTFVLRGPFWVLIGVSLYWACRRNQPVVWLFLLTSLAVPFFILVFPDLLLGGKRSAVTRYLISCFPAVQLAVSYGLSQGIGRGQRWAYGGLAAVLTAAIASGLVSAQARTWWSKDLSFGNAEIARIVNRAAQGGSPVLVSDVGNNYTNTGDLLSLSYELTGSTRFYLTRQPPDLAPLQQEPLVFVFRPSTVLQTAIAQQGWSLKGFGHPEDLSQVQQTPKP